MRQGAARPVNMRLQQRPSRRTARRPSRHPSCRTLANKLECTIFLKEQDDGLLDSWPLGSIIGQTTDISEVRKCPFVKDVREKLFPQRHWEFLITEKFLHGAYAVDAMKRGLDFPGPIDPPEAIADHVRRWFTTNPPFEGGWKAIVPTLFSAAALRRPERAAMN